MVPVADTLGRSRQRTGSVLAIPTETQDRPPYRGQPAAVTAVRNKVWGISPEFASYFLTALGFSTPEQKKNGRRFKSFHNGF
ncbi:MAG: hypothetical protein GY798_18045 [Hyphomicrobiales bacterium]|nr:hypothetical protein [Hyphomicrobiales bacterium]